MIVCYEKEFLLVSGIHRKYYWFHLRIYRNMTKRMLQPTAGCLFLYIYVETFPGI